MLTTTYAPKLISQLSQDKYSCKTSTKISRREREVLMLIAYEHSSKEIAKKLYLSYETVISHRKNIMSKLQVKNTAGMIRVAFQHRILSVPSE